MAGIVAITIVVSLLLGLPPACKWQLGVVRCGVWLAVVAFGASLLAALVGGMIGLPPILEVVAAVGLTLGLSLAVLAYRFYRDPERRPPSLTGAILSPADGEVIYVQRSHAGVLPTSTKRGHEYRLEELTQTSLRSGEAVVIGIAMNFLDVHVNRAPIAGRISLRRHLPGRFGSLRRPDAVFRNERATTLIEGDGFQVAVVQIASRLVRQIVGFVGEGEAVLAGQRIGVIKLGSQVDLVLPARDDLSISVQPGDRVKAGESVVAECPSHNLAPRSSTLVVAWCRFQARTTALGAALGAGVRYVTDASFGRSVLFLPLRYLVQGARMWRLLQRSTPRTLVVITAPVFAPLVGWLWCAIHRRQLVVDCHPGTFHSRQWRWARPIHRVLLRRAQVVLVHTIDDEQLVRGWGARALFLPDDLAHDSQALAQPRRSRPSIVVAGKLDPDEPVATVLAAAALLPDVEVRLTGDPDRLPATLRSGAPNNVLFLGHLPYGQFLGELLAADVVGVFTSDPHVMSRAGQDAIGLGRPLVISDLPWLRNRFKGAAVFCANNPAAMAQALQRALQNPASLVESSRRLEVALRAMRERGLAQLKVRLETGSVTP